MSGVSLALLLPASLQFNAGTDANPDASCYNGVCGASTRATWTIDTLSAGMTQVVTINAQVISAAVTSGDSISSAFTLSATGASSLTVTKAVQVFGVPQTQLTLGSTTNPTVANGEVTYDIDIGQIGTVALSGTTLRAFLSPGLIVNSVSDGGTQSAANPGEIDWDIGAVGIGASLHRSVRVTGDGTAPAGSVPFSPDIETFTKNLSISGGPSAIGSPALGDTKGLNPAHSVMMGGVGTGLTGGAGFGCGGGVGCAGFIPATLPSSW